MMNFEKKIVKKEGHFFVRLLFLIKTIIIAFFCVFFLFRKGPPTVVMGAEMYRSLWF